MNVKKCDMCGSYYDENKMMYHGVRMKGICLELESGCRGYKDLCDDCLKNIIKWFDGKANIVDKQESEGGE